MSQTDEQDDTYSHRRGPESQKGIVGWVSRREQRKACLFAFIYTQSVCARVWQYTFLQVCEVACGHAVCVCLIALWEWWWRAGWGCWLPAPRRLGNTRWQRRHFPEPATPHRDCSTRREPCWGEREESRGGGDQRRWMERKKRKQEEKKVTRKKREVEEGKILYHYSVKHKQTHLFTCTASLSTFSERL